MEKPDYSVVIPVYKSVTTLEPLFNDVKQLMGKLQKTFEVIYVEDSGSEDSWRKLLELKNSYGNLITIIRLTKNFGQNGATLCGIDESVGEHVLTIDDDLQVSPLELEKLICYMNEHQSDVVFGVSETSGTWLRKLGSRAIKRAFMKAEHGSNVGSSVRLIKSHIVKYLRNHSQDHLFINQVITWYTFNTGFVLVTKTERQEGETGYSIWKLLNIGFRLIFLYSSIPLRVMIIFSVLSAGVSLTLAAYYLYINFSLGNGQGFMVYVVLTLALILASISVMGIYISRIYSARVRKPQYAIQVRL